MATGVPSSQRSGVVSQSTFYELLKHVERRVGVLERSSRLRSASIGEGGIRVYGGGDISIEDSGSLTVEDSAGNTEAAIGQGKAEFFDNGLTTAVIGEYEGTVWTGTSDETGQLRGLALYNQSVDPDTGSLPFLQMATLLEGPSAGKNYFQCGLTSTENPPIDFMDLRARSIVLYESDSGTFLFIGNEDVTISLLGQPTSNFRVENLNTSGGAANMNIDAGTGTITRSVSGLKYKENIEPAVIDPDDVLQLAAKTFTVKGDTSGTRYTGVIAEDLDALASLRQFVVYDSEGVPDSVNYDRLALPVLELVKHLKLLLDTLSLRVDVLSQTVSAQQAQIDALTAQNAAQQQTIDDLTARMEAVEGAQLQPATYTSPSGHAIKTMTVNDDGTLSVETIKVGGLL